jgi:hypothetical protein
MPVLPSTVGAGRQRGSMDMPVSESADLADQREETGEAGENGSKVCGDLQSGRAAGVVSKRQGYGDSGKEDEDRLPTRRGDGGPP